MTGTEVDDEEVVIPEDEQAIAEKEFLELNNDQKLIVKAILDSIDRPEKAEHKCFFVDGVGGTGKTTTYNVLCRYVRGNQYNIHECKSSLKELEEKSMNLEHLPG